MFVRAAAAADGSTLVTVGGLARSDAAGGFETEFAELAELLRAEHGGTAAATPAAGPTHQGADAENESTENTLADVPEAETAGAGADRHEAALTRPDGE